MDSPHKELPPLTGGQLILATLAVALATFMNVLDSSIANVAIPTLSGNLGVSIDEGTWVITLFAAATAISIPLTGWLTQRLGQIRLFVGSILLFVFSSWLCGIAPTLPILLAARILQGAVAGPLIPLSQAILLSSYSKAKSGVALSLWAMTATVGPIAGPALGGWITDSYSWSWIFYQHPGRPVFRRRDVGHLQEARNADPQDRHRQGRPAVADRLGRLAADHARQGQGPGLVPVAGDLGAVRVRTAQFYLLRDLGAD